MLEVRDVMKTIYSTLLAEIESGRPAILATLIKTRGSTPQVPGAIAVFNAEGLIAGTLGGGILEAEAEKMARQAITERKDQYIEFSLDSEITNKLGAICGGNATFLLDANPQKNIQVFTQVERSLKNRKPGVLISIVHTEKNNPMACKTCIS